MSNHPNHRARRRARIQVELLESRALLSASSVSSTERFLLITPSSESVNQEEGSFTVTLSLAQAQAPAKVPATGGYTPAALDEPVTVDFSASVDSTSSEPTTAASPFFTPFNESVTFPAGASTESITVPIISTAATPAPASISLSATTTSSAVKPILPIIGRGDLLTGSTNEVELYSSPSAVPPTVTSVQLVTRGNLASAVVLGFSKPMVPATVENIHNYRILSRPIITEHSSFTFSEINFSNESITTEYQSFPIAAATYDPSTSTVTLMLKRPTKASLLYQVSSAYPLRGHALTDVQGQPLSPDSAPDTGVFTIGVRGFSAQAVSWAPRSLKSTL